MNERFSPALIAFFFALTSNSAGQVREREIRDAATKSVAVLGVAAAAWFDKQECYSCHHQSLPLMVFDLAHRHGVENDPVALDLTLRKTFGYLTDLDRAVQGSHVIDPVLNQGIRLVSGAPFGLPRSVSTGAYVRLIARRQLPDGHWTTVDARPPQSYSRFSATAFALRALQLFLPEQMAEERRSRVARAATWLAKHSPADTEDYAGQLLGLNWAATQPTALNAARNNLLAQQRADGGWGQMPGVSSDAYATGEALTVLAQTTGISTSGSAYQAGLTYLLQTRKADGTWFVASRLHTPAPLSPPYFETGLPYGRDQFISAMGTCWATAALLLALPEAHASGGAPDLRALQPADVPSWAGTVLFGRDGDVRALLDSGWDPNSSTPNGTTALMMAAADPAKTAILLRRGARADAQSKTRYTALMIAASHHATGSVRLLLDRKAEAQPQRGEPALFGATPLFYAAWSGDIDAVKALRSKGVDANPKMIVGGFSAVDAFTNAAQSGDAAMVGALIREGVPVDHEDPDTGITALGWAVFRNDTKLARFLIAHGASVNHYDKLGYTSLHWAANVDFGHSSMVELLLRSGANPLLRTRDGLTARDLTCKFGYGRHERILIGAAGVLPCIE